MVSYDSCALTAASADVPSLFSNLSPKCKPIAVKSRRFNNNDQKFIDEEIHRLHSEGIIRPSVSPWRAQVVVVKNAETNKRRMCIRVLTFFTIFSDPLVYMILRGQINPKCQCKKFFQKFCRLDTLQEGRNFSGGQKPPFCISRKLQHLESSFFHQTI